MYRKTLSRILFVWLFLIIVVALFGKVSVAASDAGRTCADFLLIGLGARGAALGGAFTAATEGAMASYWNAAGLADIEHSQVALGHFALQQDMHLEHLAAAARVSDRVSAAVSVTYLGYGQIDGYDANGITTGDIAAYDWVGAVSAGLRLTGRLSAGVTAKFINQKLDDLSGSTFAADLGARYVLNRLTLAATLSNVGADMVYGTVTEKLPATLRLGVSAFPISQSLRTTFDLEKRLYGQLVLRNGFEMGFYDQYYLRAGYSYFPGQEQREFGSGLVFGLGLRWSRAHLDYAYSPSDQYTFDDQHRLSVILEFGP